MIRFLSGNYVEVFTTSHGKETMEVRDHIEGEDMLDYMDYIMNVYWYKVGKNMRLYDDDDDEEEHGAH